MNLIEEGRIKRNVVYFTSELKNRFAWHFERYKSGNDALNPGLPFFHLRSSGFWHHIVRPGQEETYKSLRSPSEKSILETIEHVSLDPELYQLLQDPVCAAQLRIALADNLDSREEGFEQWAKATGRTDKTIKNYIGALKGSISNWLSEAGLIEQNLLTISDYFEIQRLSNGAMKLQEFSDYDSRGKGMYKAALNLYREYLDELTDATVIQDVYTIEQDSTLQPTEKTILVQARRGQGKFRERLIAHWKRCAVTHYDKVSLLVASHIKSWAKSNNGERLDPYNGLLLSPNLDKAFDLHYLSFAENGKLLIAEQLGDYEKLGIYKEMTIPLHSLHQEYMAFHRESFYNKRM
ncbi:MAG: HNH endonuclease [Idiomarina sp.]|nr:HNH endonuclease [Idiomarina sp.]